MVAKVKVLGHICSNEWQVAGIADEVRFLGNLG
jgi:hypothetical protein